MAKQQGISINVVKSSLRNTVKNISDNDKRMQEAISKVIAEVGVNIQRDAKRNAPVDFGFLRASIYLDFKGQGRQDKSGIRGGHRQLTIPLPRIESRKDGLDAIIGSDLDYSLKMERRDRFLQSAYRTWAPKIKPSIEKEINKILRKHQ
ncbi:MAG: HK97 gp10 family phage protein [Cryomorphaceae bacterium]|nr:MAG: HK97 gp10 family phage protein [Cryomorphaceae bacterium]